MISRGPERKGMEMVEENERHGRPFSLFIIWFASNLTIADWALGSALYGLPLTELWAVLLVANATAGAMLGLMSAMGPSSGLPQMAISRGVFGHAANRAFSALAWVTMVGWFSVNVIISTFALQELLPVPYWAGALISVVIMGAVGFYGHDAVHYLERAMSVVLGVAFALLLYVVARAVTGAAAGSALAHYEPSFSPYLAAVAFVSVFSYLASWAPYASDYSRYLPRRVSARRLVAYTALGGALASLWLEVLGTYTYVAVGNPGLSITSATVDLVGRSWAPAVMLIIFLGGLAANALNLYSASIAAQAIYLRFRRMYAALAGAAVGYALSLIGGMYSSFSTFYTTFLEFLAYWIMPWAGVMIARVYLSGRIRAGALSSIISYAVGLASSVPFMNLTPYGISFVGPVALAMGGADFSYLVSFAVAFVATAALGPSKREATPEHE